MNNTNNNGNMNNVDMAKLMEMLSKMDKKELEAGLNKVSKMLKMRDGKWEMRCERWM